MRMEERPEKLYTPQNSKSFADKTWTEANFGFGPRMVSVAVVAKDVSKDNVLDRDSITQMFDMWEEVPC